MAGMRWLGLAVCLWRPLTARALTSNGSMMYDEEEAKKFASITQSTYCEDMTHVEDWTCTSCKNANTPLVPGKIKAIDSDSKNASRVLVGKLRDQPGCVLSFRGSYNSWNWHRDFQFLHMDPKDFSECKGCKVHHGFYSAWKNIRFDLLEALGDVGCVAGTIDGDLYMTGHSYGAALSILAMFALDDAGFHIKKNYAFESPRVGNQAFSDAFSWRFANRFPVFRLTNRKDPVVHLPMETLGYEHVQREVYYDSHGKYHVCAHREDSHCSNKHAPWWNGGSWFWMIVFSGGDHCGNTPLVPNGDFCNPIGCNPSHDDQQSVLVV